MDSRKQACACALATALFAAPQAAIAGSLSITWDPNTEGDLVGYLVRYGTQPGTYTQVIDVGNRTAATIPNRPTGGVTTCRCRRPAPPAYANDNAPQPAGFAAWPEMARATLPAEAHNSRMTDSFVIGRRAFR